MRCPRCDVDLEVKRYQDVDVDVCERCRGMLLARGELNKVAGPTPGDLEFTTVDQDSFQHEDRHGPTDCPSCGDVAMKKVDFNIYTDIILDWCERCGSFWLDGPEMDRINDEVRRINDAGDEVGDPKMLWFARFIWSLPR